MAKKINIPTRPKNDVSGISEMDKDILTYWILFGCDRQTAFLRHHWEYADPVSGKINKAGKDACKEFFSSARNKEYVTAYRETLAGIYIDTGELNEEDVIDDERKNRALQKLLHAALRTVEKGEATDPEVLKTITDIFKRLGILQDNGDKQEAPRRYLPERCSACRYKIFVEEQIELGNVEERED